MFVQIDAFQSTVQINAINDAVKVEAVCFVSLVVDVDNCIVGVHVIVHDIVD